MPRLIDNSGQFRFVIGITENKSVPPTVFRQPQLRRGMLLRFIELLIVYIDNVYRQTQLMFTGSRNGYLGGS